MPPEREGFLLAHAGQDLPGAVTAEWEEGEEVRNLPSEWPVREGQALAVRRFDRPEPGHRIHQEDFAQILDVYPEDKYGNASHETLGRILQALTGPEGLEEYIRRLVLVVLSGNGDAHLKNWTLVYPDGRTPKLSPLYDQVFTRAFLENDDLALKLAGERDFYRIDGETFRRFADRVGAEPSPVGKTVKEVSAAIRTAWSETRSDLPLTDEVKRQLDTHLEKVQL